MKAGLMEIADVFAVNKADRPEADKLVKELITMVGMNDHDANTWMIPVLKTEAVRDVGVNELLEGISAHQAWLTKTGHREVKGRRFLKEEVLDILVERLERSVAGAFETSSGRDLLDQLLRREIDPYSAADLISGV
jgi:LAO/AO transport system kinase